MMIFFGYFHRYIDVHRSPHPPLWTGRSTAMDENQTQLQKDITKVLEGLVGLVIVATLTLGFAGSVYMYAG